MPDERYQLIKCESTLTNVQHWYMSAKEPYKTYGLNLCSMCKAQYKAMNKPAMYRLSSTTTKETSGNFKQCGSDTL